MVNAPVRVISNGKYFTEIPENNRLFSFFGGSCGGSCLRAHMTRLAAFESWILLGILLGQLHMAAIA